MFAEGITVKTPLTSSGMLLTPRVDSPGILQPVAIVDWFEITEETAVTLSDPIAVYAASKAIAEKALWAYAKEHPELNIITRTSTPAYHIGTLGLNRSQSVHRYLSDHSRQNRS